MSLEFRPNVQRISDFFATSGISVQFQSCHHVWRKRAHSGIITRGGMSVLKVGTTCWASPTKDWARVDTFFRGHEFVELTLDRFLLFSSNANCNISACHCQAKEELDNPGDISSTYRGPGGVSFIECFTTKAWSTFKTFRFRQCNELTVSPACM